MGLCRLEGGILYHSLYRKRRTKSSGKKRLPALTPDEFRCLVGAFPISLSGEFEGSGSRPEAHKAAATTNRPLDGNDPRRRSAHDRTIRGGVDCVQHVVPSGVREPIDSAANWATWIFRVGTLIYFAHRVLLRWVKRILPPSRKPLQSMASSHSLTRTDVRCSMANICSVASSRSFFFWSLFGVVWLTLLARRVTAVPTSSSPATRSGRSPNTSTLAIRAMAFGISSNETISVKACC